MKSLYHIMNRGVEGRDLFGDTSDYVRFVHNLYEFNDSKPAAAFERRPGLPEPNVGSPRPYIRKQIVEIHGWCLMKNHYHLILSEKVEKGIPLFLRKINTGYANYFNARYERSGALYQGKTKKIPISSDPHFLYILHYIHLNPLDYLEGATEWRFRSKGGIRNRSAALKYLEQYRWSSLSDYLGVRNFPSVLSRRFFGQALGSYKDALDSFLKDAEEMPSSLVLEPM